MHVFVFFVSDKESVMLKLVLTVTPRMDLDINTVLRMAV